MKFQCWRSPGSITFATVENIATQIANGMLEDNATLQYTIEAETYNDAMQQHYSRQGWGKYRPLEDS